MSASLKRNLSMAGITASDLKALGYNPYKRKKTVVKPQVPAAVKRYVKRATANAGETKLFVVRPGGGGGASALAEVNAGVAPVTIVLAPSITQGDAADERIGNKVKVVRSFFRGTLTRSQSAAGGPNFYIRLVIAKLKNSTNSPGLNDYNDILYDTPGAVPTNFSTRLLFTKSLPYNKDMWTICYEQEFKIGAAGNTNAPYQNNDFVTSANFNVDITKYFKKTWLYTPGNPLPNNDGLYAFFVPWSADEAAPAGAPTVPVITTYSFNTYYKDD